MRFSVLVADDEKMPREILRDRLPWEELGVERVDAASDGAEALELARQHRPDIIISDVKMPRMNGLELAGAVREMYPECQFIFLSGYTDKEYLKGAIKLRAASYVEKPIDLEEVAAVLRQVICKAYAALHRGEHVHFILRHFLDEPGGSRVESSAPEHNLAGCA